MFNLKTYIMRKSRLSALLLAAALLVPSMSVKAEWVDETTGITYTAIDGSKNGNEGFADACDGNVGTKFGTGDKPNWVVIKASEPVYLNGYTIITANDNEAYKGRNPKDWTLEGSTDKYHWTLITEVKDDEVLQDVNFTPFDFDAKSIEAFTYFRFTVKATQDAGAYMQYSELHLNGVKENPLTFTAIDGTAGFGGEGWDKVCDGNFNTKFCTNVIPSVVVIEASVPIYLTGYTIATANDTKGDPGRNPKDWTIEGSNDLENWAVITEVKNDQVLGATNFTPYDFNIAGAKEAYKYFRYTVSANKGSGVMQYSEIALKGQTAQPEEGVGANGETKLLWLPDVATIGGHLTYVNGKGDELAADGLTLNGYAQNLNDLSASAEAGHALVTLDKVLTKGDVMVFTTAAAGGGLHFVFSNGFEYEQEITGTQTKVIIPDEAVGSAAVIITRTDASTAAVVVKAITVESFTYTVASPWAGNEVGDFIARLYNPTTESFLAQGNAYGTQATRDAAGLRFNLTKQEDGLYKIVTCVFPDRHFGWDNGSGFYVDINQQAKTFFAFEPASVVENSDRVVYTIKAFSYVGDELKLEGYLSTNADPENTVVYVQDYIDEYALWQVIDDTKRMGLEKTIAVARAKAAGKVVLQTTDEAAAGYIWTNAQEPSEGAIANLIDGNTNTFFHTAWSAASDEYHYLAVDLGEGESMKEFVINYTRRMNNNNNRPTEIVIAGSNDKETWNDFRTLTQEADALPTESGDDSYASPVITADQAYRYIRFTVTHTNNEARSGSSNSLFFTFSEFAIGAAETPTEAQQAAIEEAIAAAEAVLNDPTASDEDIKNASADLEQNVKDALAPNVESPFVGDVVADGGFWAFYNPETKSFLNQGNAWGTQASRAESGLRFTLTANEEGLYKIVTNKYPSNVFGWDAGSGFFVDITNQATTNLKFERVKTQDDAQYVYTIKVSAVSNSDASKTLEGYLATNADNTVVDVVSTPDKYAYWQILDETTRQALEDAIAVAQNKAKDYLNFEAVTLQTDDEAAAGYLWSNAPDEAEGQHPEYMLDGDVNTFFHSDWHGKVTDTHFLQVNLGEGNGLTDFAINYNRRMNNNNNRPTEIVIKGSNDGENWAEVRTLTQAADNLPTVAGTDSYVSGLISADQAYDFYRFDITKTNNSTIFFTFSEFGISKVTKNAGYDEVLAAVAEAKTVLDNPVATKDELREARKNLLRGVFPIADGTYYLYNKESGKFLSRGAAWGTQAALGDFGLPFVVSTPAAGLTWLSAMDWQDCHISLTNGTDGGTYVDQTSEGDLVYEYAGGDYIFKNTAAGYLAVEDNENTKPLFGLGVHGTEATALRFQLLSAAEYEKMIADRFDAEKAAAMQAAGVDDIATLFQSDATDKVQSASLVNSNEGWTWTGLLYRGGGITTNENGTETWQGCGTLAQTVEGLQPGLYKVGLYGFFRIDGERVKNVEWYNNGYVMSTAFLAANGNEVRIKPVGAEATINEAGDGIYPNWMNESKACFDEGKYLNEVYAYVGEDGKLDISVTQPTWKGDCWLMLGGVTLTYYSTEGEAINGEEGTTGINSVAAEVVSRTYYNANGAEIAEPAQGVNVVKSVMSDGTIKVEKVLVK